MRPEKVSSYVLDISITKDKIKSNWFHKLSWKAYGNKLETVYRHPINYFHKLSQRVTQMFGDSQPKTKHAMLVENIA
jgi:hypothetical protein